MLRIVRVRIPGVCGSRGPDRSLSRSTSRLHRAYCSRGHGKSRSAVCSHSCSRYHSVSTTKSRRSRSNSLSVSRSSSGSFRSHGLRSRCSHSHRSRQDSGATPGVATGLTEATVPVLKQPAVDRMAGADAPVPMIAGTNPANYRCQAVEAMFH